MTQGLSTWWVKYSDYCIEKTENGTEYIFPAPQAVPMAYDLMPAIGRQLEKLAMIVHADEEKRTAMFVKQFGLLGISLEDREMIQEIETLERAEKIESGNMTAETTFLCTRREPKYAAVFSKDYREKTAYISAWLDWLDVLFNRSQSKRNSRLEQEPFVALTLQTMLESAFKNSLADRSLRVCVTCKKIFYNPDLEARTCCEDCRRRFEDMEHYQWLKERFQRQLTAGV